MFKKSIILLLFLLNFVSGECQSLKLILSIPFNTIESKWENYPMQKGTTCLNYYNHDKCPYYLYREFDRSYKLNPGKNTIFIQRQGDQNPFKQGTYYDCYKGYFPKELDLGIVYSFPFKSGNIEWRKDTREHATTFHFKAPASDTLYASRGGVVCKTTSSGVLLIHHIDGTFAGYFNLAVPLVNFGEKVKVGDPIALANYGGISLTIFFLDKNLFAGGKPSGYCYTHISPFFRTVEGDIRLNSEGSSIPLIDDDLIMQDMSKSERKKYLKKSTIK